MKGQAKFGVTSQGLFRSGRIHYVQVREIYGSGESLLFLLDCFSPIFSSWPMLVQHEADVSNLQALTCCGADGPTARLEECDRGFVLPPFFLLFSIT